MGADETGISNSRWKATGGGGRPITVEDAARLGRLYRRAGELAEAGTGLTEVEWVGLVNGSAYRDLCLGLIGRARHEIVVVMF